MKITTLPTAIATKLNATKQHKEARELGESISLPPPPPPPASANVLLNPRTQKKPQSLPCRKASEALQANCTPAPCFHSPPDPPGYHDPELPLLVKPLG